MVELITITTLILSTGVIAIAHAVNNRDDLL